MKKVLTILAILVSTACVFAEQELYEAVYDNNQVVFSPSLNVWSTESVIADNEIVLTKKVVEGTGSYSQYYYTDGKRALTLTSNFEFVKQGVLVSVNNAELKYNKVVYDGEGFQEVPLAIEELQELFPDIELFRLSLLDADNKMWIKKRFKKDRQFLFVNDSDKYYYNLTANCSKAQNEEIRGLITIYRYGIFRFKHYGEHNGKMTLYVR